MVVRYALQKDFPDDPLFVVMEHSNEHIFITGKAGTGKSTILQKFLRHTKKNVAVLAPTGLAAINVGGQTLHSFFKLPPHIITRDEIDKKRFPNDIYAAIDAVVIDEISMVRVDVFDAVDGILRKYGDSKKPFGGKQLILFGDLFQLPPVVEDTSKKLLQELGYETSYFFSAHSFPKDMLVVDLTKVYRQSDPEFISFLDLIRTGKFLPSDLDYINSRVLPHDEHAIILTTRNHLVQSYNSQKLAQLPGENVIFHAVIQGAFPEKHAPAEKELVLKVGARVIFIKNDSDGQWVNGTLGVIKHIGRELTVETDDGFEVNVKKERWKNIQYSIENGTLQRVEKGHYDQYPLRLAWALTIHKSQGQTFDGLYLDLTSSPWEHGHVYVALSRCRSKSGLRLKQKLLLRDVIVDQKVIDFFTTFDAQDSEKSAILHTSDHKLVALAYADFSKLFPVKITYASKKCVISGKYRKAFYVYLKTMISSGLTDIRYSEQSI